MAASFPKNKGSESKVEAAISFMNQEVTPHHFHNILLVTEVSTSQGERSITLGDKDHLGRFWRLAPELLHSCLKDLDFQELNN